VFKSIFIYLRNDLILYSNKDRIYYRLKFFINSLLKYSKLFYINLFKNYPNFNIFLFIYLFEYLDLLVNLLLIIIKHKLNFYSNFMPFRVYLYLRQRFGKENAFPNS